MQHYEEHPADPADVWDEDVNSPKSVAILPDGLKAYVNSLEGCATVVYDARTYHKLGVIPHRFDAGSASLFSAGPPYDYRYLDRDAGESPDAFEGKPVEMAFTHGGRYLWVSYYRRDYDRNSAGPSAVAVVDTATDAIVRVLPSGPIPKFLATSTATGELAMIHWGDNTIGFVDIAPRDPSGFRLTHLVTVGERLSLARFARAKRKVNRDRACGSCLRGSVFTPDGRYLLTAKLSGSGGVAVVDVSASRYVGTAQGMQPSPRHLLLRGDRLYVGSNADGYVAWFRVDDVIKAAQEHRAARPRAERFVGLGVRTIALSPDGRRVFAAVNKGSKLVALDADRLAVEAQIPVDSFPVGLDVSPDGMRVWVTSQGRDLRGGNSVSIYAVETRPPEEAPR